MYMLIYGLKIFVIWRNRHHTTYISFTHKSNLIKAKNSRLKSYLSRFYYRLSSKDGLQPRSKNLSAREDFAGFYLSSPVDSTDLNANLFILYVWKIIIK